MSNQRLIIGSLGFGNREFRFSVRRPGRLGDAFTALGDQRRLQYRDVVWKGIKTRIHVLIES
jgi:hypothetical protein